MGEFFEHCLKNSPIMLKYNMLIFFKCANKFGLTTLLAFIHTSYAYFIEILLEVNVLLEYIDRHLPTMLVPIMLKIKSQCLIIKYSYMHSSN